MAGIATILAGQPTIDGSPLGLEINVTKTTTTTATSAADPSISAPPTASGVASGVVSATAAPSAASPQPTAAPPAQPKSPTPDAGPAQVLQIVNSRRQQAGCGPLTPDPRLTQAAQSHSDDMSAHDYFSHTSPDGRNFVARSYAAGYWTPAAENIAKGQRTADAVMDSWMSSGEHRANIVNCSYRTIGTAYAPNGSYWTQMFGY